MTSQTPHRPITQLQHGRWSIAQPAAATFRVANLGLKTVRGCIPIRKAEIDFDEEGLIRTVLAELDLAAIDTGNRRRNADLAKPKLLDTNRFGLMTFRTLQPITVGSVVPGLLTAHDHSLALDLAVTTRASDDSDQSVGIYATTDLDRTALGISAPRFLIGRMIHIELNVTFRRQE